MPVDAPVDGAIDAVVWDIGRVLVQWRIASLYEKLIADPRELDWFLANVVTEEWHAQHDAGVPLAEMIAARSAEFPAYRPLIEAYAPNWLDAVPGPVTGTHELVRALDARGMPQFSITISAPIPGRCSGRPSRCSDHFRDIVVSGVEKLIKPDAAIFALAARRFGHEPARMLFIDDNAANIAAADALGWHTHHFRDDAVALRADLEGAGPALNPTLAAAGA
jgi:2-haloacid dehalogenase